MALNAERTPPPIRKGPRCTVCVALSHMDAADRAVLLGWIDDVRITDGMTAEWVLRDAGMVIAVTAIGRHRRRNCQGAHLA